MKIHTYAEDWRFTNSGSSIFLQASQVALVVKNSSANAGDIRDVGSIPGLGGSPEEGNGNLLQYCYLENSMDREAWQATVHEVLSSSSFFYNFTIILKSAYSHGGRFPQTIRISKYVRKQMKGQVKRTGLP